MDEAVKTLLGTGSLILGLTAFIGTFIIRRIVETAVPTARKQIDANAPGATYLTEFSLVERGHPVRHARPHRRQLRSREPRRSPER